jgi:carnitine 3-dehydrogenase
MSGIATPDLPLTGDMMVPPEWTDYNGHMNEAFYLVAAAGATDRFLDMIGAGPAYVATGRSFFTVETHIRYLAEVESGMRLIVTTQLLGAEGKRLHLFHRILRDPAIAEALAPFAAHSALHAEGAGRSVGQRS